MNDLSKDFMQILNISKDKERRDSTFLYCQIDPSSKLFEPIEALRKHLFKEMYADGESSSSDDEAEWSKLSAKEKKNVKEMSKLEKYMDRVEKDCRKKLG